MGSRLDPPVSVLWIEFTNTECPSAEIYLFNFIYLIILLTAENKTSQLRNEKPESES